MLPAGHLNHWVVPAGHQRAYLADRFRNRGELVSRWVLRGWILVCAVWLGGRESGLGDPHGAG
jgi:hypothetical protein